MDSLEEQVSYLILHRRLKQPVTKLIRHYALLSFSSSLQKNHLIVHMKDRHSSIFLLFCPLLAFRLLPISPQIANPNKRPAKEKESTKTTLRGISTRTYKNRKKGQRQKKKQVVKGIKKARIHSGGEQNEVQPS